MLAVHGMTAIIATLGLGSVLPFHLKVDLKANRKVISGISQLIVLSILTVSGALLYYGPAVVIRDDIILIHWLTGLLFFSLFTFHGVLAHRRLHPS